MQSARKVNPSQTYHAWARSFKQSRIHYWFINIVCQYPKIGFIYVIQLSWLIYQTWSNLWKRLGFVLSSVRASILLRWVFPEDLAKQFLDHFGDFMVAKMVIFKKWRVYFMIFHDFSWKILLKWMRTGGTPMTWDTSKWSQGSHVVHSLCIVAGLTMIFFFFRNGLIIQTEATTTITYHYNILDKCTLHRSLWGTSISQFQESHGRQMAMDRESVW